MSEAERTGLFRGLDARETEEEETAEETPQETCGARPCTPVHARITADSGPV